MLEFTGMRKVSLIILSLIILLTGCLPIKNEVLPPPTMEPTKTLTPFLPVKPTNFLLATLTPSSTPTVIPLEAENNHCRVTHRSGQTFITWREISSLKGESYRIYRSPDPITAKNYHLLQPLYEVYEGSGIWYSNRYTIYRLREWHVRWAERLIIEDFGEQLPQDDGLLVWTISPDDLGNDEGDRAYYMITVVTAEGDEYPLAGYDAGPIYETVADPAPVELRTEQGAGVHVYLQYMDLRNWNPTYHAPNYVNYFYGLDPFDDRVKNSIQYAYDYKVIEPDLDACGGKLPEKAPVLIFLHGWGGNQYRADYKGLTDPMCAYQLLPLDIGETWYFGFARNHDYHSRWYPGRGDVIVNYTEQRILRMVYDLLRNPPGVPADENRVYVYGFSMGGSGALAFALRYPNVFAAAYASMPMTDYTTSGDGGGFDWRKDVEPKWGAIASNLPIVSDALHGWADHLKKYDGSRVYTWQNHQLNLVTRKGDDMVPLGIAHGLKDTAIEWSTQGEPVYQKLNSSQMNWGGAVMDIDHAWTNFLGMPTAFARVNGVPFWGLQAVKNETVPGLSYPYATDKFPPSGEDSFNQTILWSSSWYPWDGAPVDQRDVWQISFCAIQAGMSEKRCGTGRNTYTSVTLRRLQQFEVVPGVEYQWENTAIADGTLLGSGKITPDSNGLLTVPLVLVVPEGNRLRITPVE